MESPSSSEEKKVDPPTSTLQEQEGAFAETFFEAILGAQLIQTAYIGHKLGWYDALRKAGDDGLTCIDLANETSSSTRYAQEWLEQQAVAGWIVCINPTTSNPQKRIFYMPRAHGAALANVDSLNYVMPLAVLHGGIGKNMNSLIDAYKKDTGVSWNEIGDDASEAQAAMNRPYFLQKFASDLSQCLDESTLDKLMQRGSSGGGRIADIGVGYGYSSIGVAKYFPGCTVDAFDLDEPSIEHATQNIKDAGLEDRVKAHCMDAASVLSKNENNDDDDGAFEPYDVVMALECVHDMNDPISVLRTMRKLAGSGKGTVIVMDERVAHDFASGIANPVEQAMYGFSCVCCLADGMSTKPSVATGTVMRPKMLRAYAQQAGFRDLEIMPVENDFFRFYKLVG